MKTYTIQQLASMAGVSVRTLHHYDHIKLLSPQKRRPNGYREYGDLELFKLQQILFYKELDFCLEDINIMLNKPGFKFNEALLKHKNVLNERIKRLKKLIQTIDKTILHINKQEMITDEELYEGFSKEQKESYDKEARERWGNKAVNDSIEKAKKMTKHEYAQIKAETEAIGKEVAKLMETHKAESKEVQEVITRHYNWIGHFYQPTPEVYSSLGQMYVDDSRFKKFYDAQKSGLAEFLNQAIQHYVKTVLIK
jgi:DNA-binding transcriptional MerR regulator